LAPLLRVKSKQMARYAQNNSQPVTCISTLSILEGLNCDKAMQRQASESL
jgi:hypothetical protein